MNLLTAFYTVKTRKIQYVKHGRWIKRKVGYDTYYFCSVCDHQALNYKDDTWPPKNYITRHCPDCGAQLMHY